MRDTLQASRFIVSTTPTGREPKLLWTPARQLTINRMKADYEANTSSPATLGGRLYKQYKAIADAGTSYFEYGAYATFMFQATGDTAYADKAWTALNRTGNVLSQTSPGGDKSMFVRTGSGLGSNFGREFSISLVMIYDWLYPGLSPANRATFLAQLNTIFTYQSTEAVSLDRQDSDQTTGTFLGVACLYYATNDHNPTAASLWTVAANGGITATAADYATKRNAVKYYVTVPSAGGEWCESAEYNVGTPRLAVYGNECLKTTAAATSLSEIDALVPYVAKRMMYMTTPDKLESFQWGDEQNPRQFAARIFSWYSTCMALVGAMADSTPERQQLQRYLLNVFATQGEPSSLIVLWPHGIFLYDPYATAAADLSGLAKGWYASGNGMSVFHDAIETATSASYWYHFRPEARTVHHHINYFGDYQLYRKGEWAITHPIAYSANGITGQGSSYLADMVNCNTIESFSGFPSWLNNLEPFGFRRMQGQRFGTDYSYAVATQGGLAHPTLDIDGQSNYFDPPPIFCHENTRTLGYLSTADQSSTSIVVVDRINVENPESLTKFARYRTANPPEQTLIAAQPRWVSYLHQRTNPVITSNLTEWTTAGGQLCKDEWLLPTIANVTITEQDETALSPYDCTTGEKKWRTKVMANADVQWNFLVRVVSVRDSGKTHTSTLLTGTSSSYGVLVTRTGVDDRIVIFNGTQSSNITAGSGFPSIAQLSTALTGVNLRATTFTITWTQTTTNAKVLIWDLNPANTWTTNLDGAGAQALTVDSAGTAEYTTSSSGAHSLVLGVS